MTVSKEKYTRQQAIEMQYSAKLVFGKAIEDMRSCEFICSQMKYGATLLQEWLEREYYQGKADRLQNVAVLDLLELAETVCTEITISAQRATTLVAMSAKCASHLQMADKPDAIQTMAEVISVLRHTGLFEVKKISDTADASYMVIAGMSLDDEVQEFALNTSYLPPMIHRPKKLRDNRSSGYVAQGDKSLILGGFIKHHDWDIALDVLNIMNSNEFEVDEEFLKCNEEPMPVIKEDENGVVSYEERKKREAKQRAIDNFPAYVAQCKRIYQLVIDEGNSAFFNHKVDTRGRVYTCGFHMSPQGNSFKKGMLNAKKREIPTGLKSFMEQCK